MVFILVFFAIFILLTVVIFTQLKSKKTNGNLLRTVHHDTSRHNIVEPESRYESVTKVKADL